MELKTLSIRPFIGAKDFELSKSFYRDLGFEEVILTPNMCLYKNGQVGFYLQDAYVQDWVDNTMIFIEVENANEFYDELLGLNLTSKYENVRLIPVRTEDWGRECFLHDPSGILWHFGEFFNK
ncbi:MAG: glyoxalase [Pedobacter sp.]|uniref:glyoxalase n=1 Tax=Pedobacter sp. TaxID=1411316 RepID=UPI00356A9AFF